MKEIAKGCIIRLVPGDIGKITTGKIEQLFDDKFSVKTPVPAFMNVGEELELFLFKENYLLKFSSGVSKIEGNFIWFSMPEEVLYIQRRETFRVNADIPLKLISEQGTYSAKTINISGGGMQFVSDKSFEINKILEARLNLSNSKVMSLFFEPLRINRKNEKYIIAGKFNDLKYSDKAALIQMCFKKKMESQFKGVKQAHSTLI